MGARVSVKILEEVFKFKFIHVPVRNFENNKAH